MKDIIYIGGTFDLFHIGHLRLLKEAQKLKGDNDILVAGVLTDEACIKWKREPIIPFEQRCEIIREFADIVIPQDDVNETKLLRKIKPKVIVHGDDMGVKSTLLANDIGAKIIYFPYFKGQSTTKIINDIRGKT